MAILLVYIYFVRNTFGTEKFDIVLRGEDRFIDVVLINNIKGLLFISLISNPFLLICIKTLNMAFSYIILLLFIIKTLSDSDNR